jgi:hypothetical protein
VAAIDHAGEIRTRRFRSASMAALVVALLAAPFADALEPVSAST